jgi:hypothetical protein
LILQFITPISFAQAATAILIAGLFTVISLVWLIVGAFKGKDPKEVNIAALILPIIPAISIALSSQALVM